MNLDGVLVLSIRLWVAWCGVGLLRFGFVHWYLIFVGGSY